MANFFGGMGVCYFGKYYKANMRTVMRLKRYQDRERGQYQAIIIKYNLKEEIYHEKL